MSAWAHGFAGAQESLDLLQAQFLCFVHADGQSSACHPLQAHLVLESHLPFRLILYWTRLGIDIEAPLLEQHSGWVFPAKKGDEFAQRGENCLLLVPSVLAPNENNCLINPAHPDYKRIVV
jgi:hypothetical protein